MLNKEVATVMKNPLSGNPIFPGRGVCAAPRPAGGDRLFRSGFVVNWGTRLRPTRQVFTDVMPRLLTTQPCGRG